MSSFTDPLAVEQLPNGREWRLLRGFVYFTDCVRGISESMETRCCTRINVDEGFITDFASIPRIFWSVIGHPAGKYAQAAVLHDYMYKTGEFSRSRADFIFRESMQVLGVSRFKTWVLWAGVRIGGFLAYHERGEE